MKSIKPVVVFLLFTILLLSGLLPLKSQPNPRFERGDTSLSIYLGGSGFGDSSSFSAGASVQYFVTDTTAPGLKVMGSYGSDALIQGFFLIDQYLFTGSDLMPFVFGEAGYYYSNLVINATPGAPVIIEGVTLTEDTRWKGTIYRLGAGLAYFFTEQTALRGEIYYQWFFLDFSQKVPGLTDIGFTLGLSLFL